MAIINQSTIAEGSSGETTPDTTPRSSNTLEAEPSPVVVDLSLFTSIGIASRTVALSSELGRWAALRTAMEEARLQSGEETSDSLFQSLLVSDLARWALRECMIEDVLGRDLRDKPKVVFPTVKAADMPFASRKLVLA